MAMASQYRVWTFEEFCDRIPEGLKADLIDGVIHVASPDNIKHFKINSWLEDVIKAVLRARKINGELFGFRIAFQLSEKNAPEPDLAYVRPERLGIIGGGRINGRPD